MNRARRCTRNLQGTMSKPQLFCFTYAGGNASFFDAIEEDIPDIDFIKPDYAGHGTRHKEPFYDNFDQLGSDCFQIVSSALNGEDYGLFGYSMGAITVVEVLKRIEAIAGLKKPSYIFLAAHEPHSKAELIGYSDSKLDEWVKERTIRFGGIPEKLINNKSFWRMYLPIYRADYSLIRKYRFEDLDLCTDIPAALFYSETDTPKTEMELWKKYFTGTCNLYRYNGTHFFIQEHHKEMANVISNAFVTGENK